MKRAVVVLAALTLAGCGSREELTRLDGKPLPVKPFSARATPTADLLLKPGPQARPARSDELVESSKERRSDEFDLPPPD